MRSATLLWPAALLGTAGCFGGGAVDLRYRPSGTAVSLSHEGTPAFYIVRVDERAGGIVLAAGERPKLLLKRPVQESLREALTVELGRLGLPAAKELDKADARLSAAIGGEITDQSRSYSAAVGLVRLTISLSIEDRRGAPLWEGELKGVGDIAKTGSVAAAANAALADAMAGLGPLLTQDRVVARIFSARADQEPHRRQGQ